MSLLQIRANDTSDIMVTIAAVTLKERVDYVHVIVDTLQQFMSFLHFMSSGLTSTEMLDRILEKLQPAAGRKIAAVSSPVKFICRRPNQLLLLYATLRTSSSGDSNCQGC